MAGAGLAVSLAYLALDRFRYRDAVEDYAKQKTRQFASEDEADTVEVVKDLQWLCRDECNGHTPRGFGANFYHFFFRNKADEIGTAFLALFAAFTLVAGVALNSGALPWLSHLEERWVVNALFGTCLVALAFPACAVLCGRRSVKWGRGFADHCEAEITKIHKRSAERAELPAAVPSPSPRAQQVVVRRTAEEAARSSLVRDPVTGRIRPRRPEDPPNLR
jgi:hypothetical protein